MNDACVVRSIDHTVGKITCMAFGIDSQYLITGGEDCSCKLWELSSGKLTQVTNCLEDLNYQIVDSVFLKVFIDHEESITAVVISEDRKYVLTGDRSGRALIWSFKDGS